MHASKIIAALLGLMIVSSACSSDMDEAQTLTVGTTGADAAFSFYDIDHDMVISPREIYEIEKRFAGTVVTSEEAASQILDDYDLDGTGRLDNIEFTGLVNARILAGVQQNPEWMKRSRSR